MGTYHCKWSMYRWNWIVYIKNESNKGLGYVLNQDHEMAAYDLIAYLSSDDYCCENYL